MQSLTSSFVRSLEFPEVQMREEDEDIGELDLNDYNENGAG